MMYRSHSPQVKQNFVPRIKIFFNALPQELQNDLKLGALRN